MKVSSKLRPPFSVLPRFKALNGVTDWSLPNFWTNILPVVAVVNKFDPSLRLVKLLSNGTVVGALGLFL